MLHAAGQLVRERVGELAEADRVEDGVGVGGQLRHRRARAGRADRCAFGPKRMFFLVVSHGNSSGV